MRGASWCSCGMSVSPWWHALVSVAAACISGVLVGHVWALQQYGQASKAERGCVPKAERGLCVAFVWGLMVPAGPAVVACLKWRLAKRDLH